MKKTLSLVLSIIMLISTFSITSFNALAYATMAEAPTVQLGETFEVEYDSLKCNTYQYYAKVVPTKTDYYEFAFDTGLGFVSGEVDIYILTKDGKEVGFDFMDKEFPEPVKTALELKAGTEYYLAIDGEKCGTYKSKVTFQKHTHKMKNDVMPAFYIKDDMFNLVEDGANYSICENCMYSKKLSTIYAPKKVELKYDKYTYDGKAKKPSVVVKDRKGNKISSSNYKVTYKNNKKVGTATVKIEFNEKKYVGEMTKTFVINPKATKIKSLTSSKSKQITVKWNKQATYTDGYKIQIATDKNFKKNKKTYTVKGAKTVSKTIKGLKGKTKYYVRICTYKTVNGKTLCSNWSKSSSVKVKK